MERLELITQNSPDYIKIKELLTKLIDNQLKLPHKDRGFDLLAAIRELRESFNLEINLNLALEIVQTIIHEKKFFLDVIDMKLVVDDIPF